MIEKQRAWHLAGALSTGSINQPIIAGKSLPINIARFRLVVFPTSGLFLCLTLILSPRQITVF